MWTALCIVGLIVLLYFCLKAGADFSDLLDVCDFDPD